MNRRTFRLVPFEASMAASGFRLGGHIAREGSALAIRYELSGPLETLLIPAGAPSPRRRDELWKHTCLECFLAAPGKARYWEVNLSPSGDWNLYGLSGYRSGLTPVHSIEALPITVEREERRLALEVRLDLAWISSPLEPLEVAICAVLEQRDGRLSHWALVHGGSGPDFHRRESFLIHLDSR